MRISARCDYACRALLELALHWPKKEPIQIQTISQNQEIPMKYLIQILIQLKRMGFAVSVRGKHGGYNLAKPPHKISLGEVMRETGGPLLPLVNSATEKKSVFAAIWKDTEDAMARVLDRVTFEDITNKARGIEGIITYAI